MTGFNKYLVPLALTIAILPGISLAYTGTLNYNETGVYINADFSGYPDLQGIGVYSQIPEDVVYGAAQYAQNSLFEEIICDFQDNSCIDGLYAVAIFPIDSNTNIATLDAQCEGGNLIDCLPFLPAETLSYTINITRSQNNNNNMFEVPSSTATTLLANITSTLADPGLLGLIAVAVALPAVFWVAKQIIGLMPKSRSRVS